MPVGRVVRHAGPARRLAQRERSRDPPFPGSARPPGASADRRSPWWYVVIVYIYLSVICCHRQHTTAKPMMLFSRNYTLASANAGSYNPRGLVFLGNAGAASLKGREMTKLLWAPCRCAVLLATRGMRHAADLQRDRRAGDGCRAARPCRCRKCRPRSCGRHCARLADHAEKAGPADRPHLAAHAPGGGRHRAQHQAPTASRTRTASTCGANGTADPQELQRLDPEPGQGDPRAVNCSDEKTAANPALPRASRSACRAADHAKGLQDLN